MRRAQTAIRRFDSLRIVGPGWSGNSRQGFQFNPASGRAGAAGGTTPPSTGACCIGGVCSITTQALCELSGGTYQGDGTICTPNPCAVVGCPDGFNILIDITLSGTCTTSGETWDAHAAWADTTSFAALPPTCEWCSEEHEFDIHQSGGGTLFNVIDVCMVYAPVPDPENGFPNIGYYFLLVPPLSLRIDACLGAHFDSQIEFIGESVPTGNYHFDYSHGGLTLSYDFDI